MIWWIILDDLWWVILDDPMIRWIIKDDLVDHP
jgi:hypothetical protein